MNATRQSATETPLRSVKRSLENSGPPASQPDVSLRNDHEGRFEYVSVRGEMVWMYCPRDGES